MPKKLQYLSDRLPKANYSVTQSYGAAAHASSMHRGP